MQVIDLPNFGIIEAQLTEEHVDLLYKDLIRQAPEGWEFDGHKIVKGTEVPQWDFDWSPETYEKFMGECLGPCRYPVPTHPSCTPGIFGPEHCGA